MMKIQRPKIQQFIFNHPFFERYFLKDLLGKMIHELKAKFLAPKDNLYKIGQEVDGMYIIMSGKLMKQVIFSRHAENQWPAQQKNSKTLWEKRVVQKQVLYPYYYNQGDIVGYWEIVKPKVEEKVIKRLDTIDAVDDTFVLFLPATQFNFCKPTRVHTKLKKKKKKKIQQPLPKQLGRSERGL